MSGARHRRRPEAAIQRAVFQHLRARATKDRAILKFQNLFKREFS
jgi:hypothetical protein